MWFPLVGGADVGVWPAWKRPLVQPRGAEAGVARASGLVFAERWLPDCARFEVELGSVELGSGL